MADVLNPYGIYLLLNEADGNEVEGHPSTSLLTGG
jgi:hypothetical protein